MKLFVASLFFLWLLCGCCHTTPPCPCADTVTEHENRPKDYGGSGGQSYPDSFTYMNRDCGFRFELPRMAGWFSGKPFEGVSKTIVFAGSHLGRMVNVVLSVEPINGGLEDYHYLINRANRFDGRPGYAPMGSDTLAVNGLECLRFGYRADVVQEPAPVEGEDVAGEYPESEYEDSLVYDFPENTDATTYVFENYLFLNRGCNIWLEISTPADAYERKRGWMAEIAHGLALIRD